MTPAMVLLQGAAMASSLLGYLILAPGFFASVSSKDVGIAGGFTLLTIAATYAWWPAPMVAATSGIRGALLGLVVLDLAWAVLAQGLAGFAFCTFPFCNELAPYGDLARYGSFVFGLAAAWTAWGAYRRATGPTQWAVPVTAVVLSVLSFAFQGASFTV